MPTLETTRIPPGAHGRDQKHLNKGLGFKANLEVQGLGFKVYGLGLGVLG